MSAIRQPEARGSEPKRQLLVKAKSPHLPFQQTLNVIQTKMISISSHDSEKVPFVPAGVGRVRLKSNWGPGIEDFASMRLPALNISAPPQPWRM
jgi:hypothetical protein